MRTLSTDILVVGGGTGGTTAAIQAARRGLQTGIRVILVSEYTWLGGMLTAAGVSAPDGNEVLALQTGMWGQFLRTIQHRQFGGVDHGWVSCFTYDPRLGAEVFAEWANALPNLQWVSGQRPVAVEQEGDRLTAVIFEDIRIQAQIILDGTELGDVLALGDVPHRWGWDDIGENGRENTDNPEPSAPQQINTLTQTYPVQLPTWVVVMQDFGEDGVAPEIAAVPKDATADFSGAWEGYGPEQFLNYGRLPGDRFMINWPQQGNDYGKDLNRLVQSEQARWEWLQEARCHTQAFARHIQTHLGRRYGLAPDIFPEEPRSLGGGAYALHPYYRESRRLQGLVTVQEQDILPQADGCVVLLPVNEAGEMEAIAIGNYANDHHYPAPESQLLTLAPKSMRWGGRYTGTPFALPYRCLIPKTIDGLLVCEKNISVSHIANGATRLQPTVMNLGQAAGMAAALCVEQGAQPRVLAVRQLQEALLTDAAAPAAVIPLLNLSPHHPHWFRWQQYYLDHPEHVPPSGNVPNLEATIDSQSLLNQPVNQPVNQSVSQPGIGEKASSPSKPGSQRSQRSCAQPFTGVFHRIGTQCYRLERSPTEQTIQDSWPLESIQQHDQIPLITLNPDVNQILAQYPTASSICVMGYWNLSGPWIRVEHVIMPR